MKYVYAGIVVLVLLVASFATVKKVSPVGWGWWGTTNTSSGLALKGYDPVAYFETGAPAEGDPEFSTEWADATWQFASAEHRDAFIADPELYAPEFGGYCAFAVSKGFTAAASPDAWHIDAGRLYVFADQNVRDDWVADLPDGALQQARANWAKR